MNRDTFDRLLRPVWAGIAAVITRARLVKVVADKPLMRAESEGAGGERRTQMPIWWAYGYHAYPKGKLPVLTGSILGARGESQVICIADNANRPSDLEEGDVELYNPESQARIRLHEDGRISVDAPGDVVANSGGRIMATAAGPVDVRAGTYVDIRAQGGMAVLVGAGMNIQCAADVTINSGGTINIGASSGVNVVGDVSVLGSITAAGNVSDLAGSMAAVRTKYNAHVHANSPTPTPLM